MQQIICSFEVDTSWLLNLMKLLISLKWLIYRNDNLTFYDNMVREETLVISKRLYKSRKECLPH